MGFLTRLIAGFVAASTLGAGLAGTANAVDAAGAASDTTGAVTTTADDTGGRTVLDCRQSGEGATGPYADNFCWIDWSNLPLSRTGEPIPVRINVPGGHIDADATITHTDNAALAAKDFTGSKWSRLTSAYKLTGNTALAFSGRMGRQDPAASVTFSNITPSADRTDTGVNVLKDFRLAFGDAEVMSGGVLQGHDVYEQTDIESDKTLEKLGMIGSGDPNQSYSKANTGYGTTHVTLAGGPKGATDDANKDSKGSAVVGAKQASRFKVSFGQVNQHWDGWGSAIAVGVYMPYLTAYPLTYDKNSSDAAGEVPSNQRGKENTTQPAKTKTNGKIRLASDTSKLSDHLVNSDFEYLPDGGWKTVDAPSYMTNAYTSVDPNNGQYMRNAQHSDAGLAWVDWPGFDRSKFAWRTDQKGGQDQGGLKDRANAVELQQDSTDGNTYAEMVASETGRTIYQDLATIPGTLYKIRLKHASLCKDNVDKMQVVINGTPIEMTRVTANGKAGDKVGEKSTTIATKVTNENRWHHADQWETYEGYYVIPDGQITTRFGFKAVNYLDPTKGNLLDDVTFARAYKLSYDKNSTDATGEVPSNQRGKENTTQPAKTKTNGTVKTVADENVRYGSLINGDFSYPSFSDIQKNEQENVADLRTFLKSDDGTLWYNMSNTDLSKYGKIGQIPGFDSSRFAWSSTENGSRVELQQDRNTKNTYAEIVAQQDNTSIYQNVSTGNGGVLYKIRLKHASRQSSHADRMQILVGSDTDHATPVEMTRVISNGHGDKVGGKSTTITTKVSNTDPRDHGAQWETYEGYYQVPEGQKNTVFMFKSLEGFKEVETLPGNNVGNLVDDIEFSRSYKLTYDANSSDASGQVPSDTTANTVKQAKAKTSGTVKTVADDDSSKSLTVNPGFDVPDYSKLDDGGLHWMYVNPSEGNAWSYYDYINPSAPKHQVSGLSQATFGWQELTGGDHKTTSFELHREKDGNVCADVHGRRTIGQTIDTQAGVAYTVSIRHSGRSKGNAGSVQVLVGPDKDHLQPLEMSRMNVSRTGAKYGDKTGKVGTVITTHSDSVDSTEGDHPAWDHSDDWETYSGTYVATGGKTVFAYRGVDENGDSVSGNDPVADSVIDDLSFKLAYRLSYDKNADDATGSVPSSQYGKENTIQPAKAKTAGTVRTVTDKTDGKVSDLVQRTTTHEDGSVTVKTIDTSTDVVSGCQVYYPAGQRITLATMAKDDDCWDSSMLSRPGHTQLGWNQDRNATQAQAQVTMVEGGMTVYAVWVGNPVLTYDTNKPSTWGGQMPSTPASVSVPYNTAAADGSGWQAGDVSKIRGYKFLGWYTAPQDNTGLYQWATPLTGNVTVYAHWQRLQANVIYDANGGTGSHAPTTGWQYSDVTIPGDTSKSFTRDGYVFKGWSLKAGKADVVYKDGSQIPLQDKDITLYAQWQGIHENFTETGGISLPLLIAGGIGLLVMGVGSTVMLTRRMNGHGMPDGE
ncbi:InlB B-repeat-containing protein [Bifidobacterium adolescentis]